MNMMLNSRLLHCPQTNWRKKKSSASLIALGTTRLTMNLTWSLWCRFYGIYRPVLTLRDPQSPTRSICPRPRVPRKTPAREASSRRPVGFSEPLSVMARLSVTTTRHSFVSYCNRSRCGASSCSTCPSCGCWLTSTCCWRDTGWWTPDRVTSGYRPVRAFAARWATSWRVCRAV